MRQPQAHQVLVRHLHTVLQSHAARGAVERNRSDVERGLLQRGEGGVESLLHAAFGLPGACESPHQFDDEDLAFLFEQVEAFLGKRQLPA